MCMVCFIDRACDEAVPNPDRDNGNDVVQHYDIRESLLDFEVDGSSFFSIAYDVDGMKRDALFNRVVVSLNAKGLAHQCLTCRGRGRICSHPKDLDEPLGVNRSDLFRDM